MDYKRILIVDDSPTSQMIIKRCFEISGYGESEFSFAGDGMEALQLLSEGEFDLLVTDLNMPKCNGMDLLHELAKRRQGRGTKILVVSSVASNAREVMGEQVLGIVQKPLSPQKIVQAIGSRT